MGKFFDALKKSEPLKEHASCMLAATTVAKISPQNVDALKLDTGAPKGPGEESAFSRNGMEQRLASFLEPQSMASESFKMLRAKLFTNNSRCRPRSIMVTSPQPLDGKTMVAANLAISIAQGINEYVMLVDCDLRGPSLDRLLGLNVNEGIREYLEDGISVAPYLLKTFVEKLTLLPAGKPPQNPSELLSSEKMQLLVDELKGRYEDRYIIFDTTPTQFVAETTFLASIVDSVVLVVRAGRTNKDMILESTKNIDRKKIVGVVFNASEESEKGYGYYYYRYYDKKRRRA